MKRPLRIVLSEEGHYNLIDILGHFSVILQPWNFLKVKFCDISSTGKTERKYYNLSAFNQDLNHSKYVKYS